MKQFKNAEFLKSAVMPKDFIRGIPQVVFAGRSNVGKSSAINALLNRKNFARVGSEPGKTVHINFFSIDKKILFVDLPGYGFAKVSKAERNRWGELIEQYFADFDDIAVGVLIVDIRHAPTADDIMMCDYFINREIPLLILANKCDKMKKSEIEEHCLMIRAHLKLPDNVKLIAFSAFKGEGKDAAAGAILAHLENV